MRLGDDRLGLFAGLLELLLGRPLGGDERLAEQRLELPCAGSSFSRLLDPVRRSARSRQTSSKLSAISARRGRPRAVAEQAAPDLEVADLDGCDGHGALLLSREQDTSTLSMIRSVTIPTIGERSSGPTGGMKRRKIRRYGSQTS